MCVCVCGGGSAGGGMGGGGGGGGAQYLSLYQIELNPSCSLEVMRS